MQRWKLSALAAATLALSSLSATDAWALALGRITVQSSLGEPLRAEVEVSQLSTAEADSLQAAIASPAAFRAQGMEYTGIANSLRVQVQKRANGTAVIKLTSSQPVNDPFVDLVIDANWASGKLQRNYTLLLDPPSSRRAPPAPITAAQVAPAPAVTAPAAHPAVSQRPATAPVNTAHRDLRNDRDQDAASPPKVQRKPPATNSSTASASNGAGEVRIKTGDTAGRIAAAHKPAGVSLDQMLVAMLRSNPQAFIGNNVNRMRSGAVIQLPDQAAAQATSAKEARQIMAAQSQDFNQFRRQLAGVAPVAPVEAASRSASGQVQAHVEDRKPSTAAPDKLTLSKGSVKGVAADEQVAQQKQSAEQSARAEELKRNMAELSQIAAATKPAGSPAAASAGTVSAPAAPGVNIPATSAPGAAESPASSTEAAPASASAIPSASPPTGTEAGAGNPTEKPTEPVAATTSGEGTAEEKAPEVTPPAPTPAPPKPAPVPPPAPEEPSFMDSLMEDPTIPLAGAALLALLLGYGGYRVAKRRKAAAASPDSMLGDSQLAADSFFGESGGQRVDTTTTSSQMSAQSMQYSPSQLDAGDVDPLAEADVYLAYGRDLQAEEILKEALRTDPNRLVLHQKLAEIYAKRHDRMAYAAVASNLHALTQGQGPEWQRLADQGRTLDPENSLYQSGGSSLSSTTTGAFSAALATANQMEAGISSHEGPPTEPADMNYSLGLNRSAASANPDLAKAAPTSSTEEQDFSALAQWETPATTVEATQSAAENNGLNLDLNDLASFALPTTEPVTPTPVAAPAQADSMNALEFDLDSFTLPLQSKPDLAKDTAPLDLTSNSPSMLETEAMTLQLPIDSDSSISTPSSTVQPDMTFDLSGLSLDLGASDTAPQMAAVAAPSEPEDPLETKLALAEEFNAIGDSDGARTLIEEVIADAQGDLKTKAQALLSRIA